MPISSEINVGYVPRAYGDVDQNGTVETPRAVKDISTKLEQLTNVTPKAGLTTVTKVLVAVAVIGGAMVVIAVAVTVGVVFGITTTTLTTRTTTSATTATVTTTTATTTSVTTLATAPGNMVAYRGNFYQNYSFMVTGSYSGGIWGTTIYTDDSILAVAAVHSGFVQYNQTTTITVMVLPGQSSYTSTTQNGITSSGYGSWSGSYQFVTLSG